MPPPASPKLPISQRDPISNGSCVRSPPPRALTAEHYGVVMIAKVVVTALLAALFGFAGLIKVVGLRQSLVIRDHLGVKPAQWRGIGLLDLAGVAGVLARPGCPPT